MKWFQLAHTILSIIGMISPQVRPLVPIIDKGIDAAQTLHGEDKPAEKKQAVLDAVAAQSADPIKDVATTENIFTAIDALHTFMKPVA